MLTKIFHTLLFFCFVAALSKLTLKQQQITTRVIQSGRQRGATRFLLAVGMSLLSLAIFWSLTGLISLVGVGALIVLSVIGHLLYQIAGAISGFTLPYNETKINTMSFIIGMMTGVRNRFILPAAAAAALLNLLVTLVVFWIYPYRHPNAIVLITFFQFVVGQVVTAVFTIVLSWPIVSSEHVDNDFRDSYLVAMFSMMFNQTALLLIGLTLAEPSLRVVCAARGWPLSRAWFFVALPMVSFVAVGVVPFFIGIYRRRAEERHVADWYADWLGSVANYLKLPAVDARRQALERQMEELNAEITSRYSNNPLYDFYEQHFHEATVVPHPDFDESQSRRLLAGQSDAAEQAPGMDIFIRNFENLYKWDLRFKHLRNMLQLREIMLQPDPTALAPYVDTQLTNARAVAKDSGQLRSVLAGSILGAFSSLFGWLGTNYGKEVVALLQQTISP
ncbi:MAG TPA: hypothetical protein VF824_00470 [Thermoanaerobaculia bacterium]|jgi:hypothetical protein